MPNYNNEITHPVYTQARILNNKEPGRNKSASIVFSYSRKTQAAKAWVAKPFGPEYDLSERSVITYLKYFVAMPPLQSYRINSAALEVYFGHLAAEIFGKSHSPKTKFNLKQRGIVSRIIGDNSTKNINFNQILNGLRQSRLTLNEQKLFLDVVLYGGIIGDRDLATANIVAQLREDDINSPCVNIYGIDHEFAFRGIKGRRDLTLMRLLARLYANPKEIARVVCDQKMGWNNAKNSYGIRGMADSITHMPYEFISVYIQHLLVESLDREMFVESLRSIVKAISANDYQVCYSVRDKIQRKISSPGAVYTPFEVKRVIDTIDEAIAKLQMNVGNIKEFLDGIKKSRPALTL